MDSIDKRKSKKDELRQKISIIEEKLDGENDKLQKINLVQDSLLSLKKNLDKCTAVLTRSLEPGEFKERFSDLLSDNEIGFKKTCGSFEEQAETLKRRVIDLHSEREAAISEYEKDDEYDENDND